METRGYKQNRIVIMLVALAGMSVYLLPYFRYYYYDAYVSYFGINDLQMGTLGSIYGVLAIVGYCLGGWIADRVSLKLAISGSLVVTGLGAFVLLLKPAFPIHVGIYALWGVTSIMTFWNPCMKALRALSKASEQGRGYALFDMTRGILNFLSGLVILAAFTAVTKKVGEANGMTGLILFSRSFFADSSYMLSFSVLCSCVCSRLISPSVSSWHKQDNTLMHQSPGHIQRRTPYNF